MSPRPSRAGVAGLAALALAMLAGCTGDENEGTPALSAGEPLGVGGTLVWTVADPIDTVDPLLARTRSERLVTRQIHEPLTATVTGPFGDTRRVPGLARAARPSADNEIWTVRLRPGVRFQDGSPFNADAVLANVARWQTTAAGTGLLPGLVDAFAPAPDIVRFILAGPDRGFDERLANPALGIVSTEALRPSSGVGAEMVRARQTGTGPFELRESGPDRQLLARNTDWWGTATGSDLGPALEQAEFRVEPSSAVRLALLDAGDVQLADELSADQAEQALADPLLNALPGAGGTWLGLTRGVRGIDSAREIPSLAGVWLTNVTVAE